MKGTLEAEGEGGSKIMRRERAECASDATFIRLKHWI